MSDSNNGAPQALDVDEVFPRPSSRRRRRSNPRGRTWPYALLGAGSSVVIVAVMIVMSLGDKYDENEVRPALTSFPEFWVCAALLILVQVGVLARAVYVRSPVWVAVALSALAFACWTLWPSVTS